MGALAATITQLALDVLAVQEVGSPEVLEDLVAELGAGWNHVLADPDGRGIRVGFLTKLPIKASEQIRDYAPGLTPVQVDDKPEPSTTTSLSRPSLQITIGTLTPDGPAAKAGVKQRPCGATES